MTEKILIVDDDASFRRVVDYTLKEEGYQTTLAEDALTALGKLDESDFSLVITDVRMPQMSGLELLTSIRAIKPEVPVILVTGFASVESAIEAVDLGVSAYIQKPFNTKEFLAKVEQVITGERSQHRAKDYLARIKERNQKLLDAYKSIRVRLRRRLDAEPEDESVS